MSFPKDEKIVAKINRRAAELHREFEETQNKLNIHRLEEESLDAVKLNLSIDTFNKFVTYKLNIDPHETALKPLEIAKQKLLLNPIKNFHVSILQNKDTEGLNLILKPDDNQIYLCGNNIVELSPNLFKVQNIKIMQLCCNYIKFLPFGIEQMRNLRVLILGKNQIKEVPWQIGFLKDLRELDLANNQISKLPKSLVALKRLNTLKLEGNLFTEIPSFIGKLQSLKMLNLSYNKIKSIPFEIFKLPFLMNLNTTGCEMLLIKQKRFEEIGRCTLKEIASRELIRRNQRVFKDTPLGVFKQLFEVQECCFCGGPFFNYYIAVEDNHSHENEIFPIHYRMCMLHYVKHEERIMTLFEKTVKTFPQKLHEENSIMVGELFELCSYDPVALKVMYEQCSEDKKMPLVCLNWVKQVQDRTNSIEEIFRHETEDAMDSFNRVNSM